MYRRYFFWPFLMLLANVLFARQMPFTFVPGGPAGVRVLFQDHLGRLWVGGGNDVACFDGSRFYSLRAMGLPAAATQAITEDEEGAIWIGSERGVYRFYGGALTEVMDVPVRGLVASSKIVLVSTLDKGAATWSLVRIARHGQAWRIERVDGLRLGPLSFGCDAGCESLLFASNERRGWEEIPVQAIASWRPGTALKTVMHETRRGFGYIARDRVGCVWNRSSTFTTYQCPGDAEPSELPSFISNESAYWWSEGTTGTMIFLNNGGLAMGRPDHFRTITAAEGLPSVDVAIKAMDGTIWLGNAKGLYRWNYPFQLEFWTAKEGFAGYGGVCRVGQQMFAGYRQEGIEVLSEDGARWLPLAKTSEFGLVYGLISDLKGGLFAGLRFGGVAQVRPDGSIGLRGGQHDDGFIKLERDLDGQLWAVGIGVQHVQQVGNRLVLEAEPGFEKKLVLDMDVQPETGQVWLCTEDGLFRKEEATTWRRITTKDGLRSNACRSLAVLANGDAWVGYETPGTFARVRVGASSAVAVKEFVSQPEGESAQTMFMDVDSRGWLWRGTHDGVYVADPADAEDNLWTRISEADGLPDGDVNKQGFTVSRTAVSGGWGGIRLWCIFRRPGILCIQRLRLACSFPAFRGMVGRLSWRMDCLGRRLAQT